MSFRISSTTNEDYMFFSAVGPVSEEALVELGTAIHRDCNSKKIKNAIVDCALMEGALSGGRLYFAVQKFVEAVGYAIKVAYINPPSHWIPDDDEFSRDVAKNQGGFLEMFASESEAVAWLRAVR